MSIGRQVKTTAGLDERETVLKKKYKLGVSQVVCKNESSNSYKRLHPLKINFNFLFYFRVSGDINDEMTINITISGPAFHGSAKWTGKGRALQFNINGGGKIDLNLSKFTKAKKRI